MTMEADLLEHGCTTQPAIGDGSCLVWSMIDAIAHGATVAGDTPQKPYDRMQLEDADRDVRSKVISRLRAASRVPNELATQQVTVSERAFSLELALERGIKAWLGEEELLVLVSGPLHGWKGNVYMFSVTGEPPVLYSFDSNKAELCATDIYNGVVSNMTDALRSLRQRPDKNIAVVNINAGHWQPIVYTHHAKAQYSTDGDLVPREFISVTDPHKHAKISPLLWDKASEPYESEPNSAARSAPSQRDNERAEVNQHLRTPRRRVRPTSTTGVSNTADVTNSLSTPFRRIRISGSGAIDSSSDDDAPETALVSSVFVSPEQMSFAGALQRKLRLWDNDRKQKTESVQDGLNMFDAMDMIDVHAGFLPRDLALVVGARWVQNNGGSDKDGIGSTAWLDGLTIDQTVVTAVRQSLGVVLQYDGGSKHPKRVAFSNVLLYGMEGERPVFYFPPQRGVWIGHVDVYPASTPRWKFGNLGIYVDQRQAEFEDIHVTLRDNWQLTIKTRNSSGSVTLINTRYPTGRDRENDKSLSHCERFTLDRVPDTRVFVEGMRVNHDQKPFVILT